MLGTDGAGADISLNKAVLLFKPSMQLSYSYNGNPTTGVPKVSLIVDIPKMRDQEMDSKTVAQTRVNLYNILNSVDDEAKSDPNVYASLVFQTIKANYQTLVLLAIVFTIEDETGQTILTFTDKDLNLTLK